MNENLIRGIIYLRTSPSGKYYVGQTCNEERRQKDWMNLNRDYSGGLINNARNKYGPENFQYEILFEVELADKDEVIKIIDEKEIYFIEKYDSTNPDYGYNISLGGKGGYITNKDYIKNNYYAYKDIEIVQLSVGGNYINTWKDVYEASTSIDKQSINIINCCNNRVMTAYNYVWMFKSDYELISSNFNNKFKRNIYGVVQLDLNGKFIKEFSTSMEAEKETGILCGSITAVCRNSPGHRTAGGYRWVFKTDYESGNYDKNLEYKNISRKVVQFNISGDIIKIWNSIKEAAEYYKTDDESIRKAADLSNSTKTSNGFRWMYEEDFNTLSINKLPSIKKERKIYSSIVQLNIDGNFIKEWETATIAGESLKIDRHGISNACKNDVDNNYYGGFRWMYKNNYESTKITKLSNKPENRRNTPIVKLDLNNNYICEFKSIKDAGLSKVFTYSHNLGKNIIIYKGYKWIRKVDYQEIIKNNQLLDI